MSKSLRRHIMMQQGVEVLPYILCGGNDSYLNTHIIADSQLNFEFIAGFDFLSGGSDYTFGALRITGGIIRYHDQITTGGDYLFYLNNVNLLASPVSVDYVYRVGRYRIVGNSMGTFNTGLEFAIGGRNYEGNYIPSINPRKWSTAILTKNGQEVLRLRACKYKGKYGFWELNGVINPSSGTPFWGSDGSADFTIDY